MQIEEYISELLYQHDCVVVPGLGGFVTDYASAKVHPVSHTFYPPSKTILFNSKLIRDDGLLLHNISVTEEISYKQAKIKVEDFVRNCKSDLEQGKKLSFEKIGTINKDIEDNILFEPDSSENYLEDSFGLPTFISPPIIRKPVHKRLEKKFVDRKPVPERDKRRKKVYWALIAAIPILLIVSWLVFNPQLKNKNAQHSSVLPVSVPEINNTDKAGFQVEENKKQTTPLKDFKFEETKEPEQKLSSSAEEQKKITTINKAPRYYIIGGAFRNKENADRLVATLRSKGYDAEHAGLNPAGLHIVSYFNSEDKSEVLVNLSMIRKNDNPSAWILKK